MFKLWDYSPSHEVLVMRDLGSEPDSEIQDHVFRGVVYVELPTIGVTVEQVRRAGGTTPAPTRVRKHMVPDSDVFELRGAAGPVGWIIAASYAVNKDVLDPSDTAIDIALDARTAAWRFEADIIRRIAAAVPDWDLQVEARLSPNGSRYDAVLANPASQRRAVVEIKLASRPVDSSWVRRLVIQLNGQLERDRGDFDAFLLIVGPPSSSLVGIEEVLETQLRTVLPPGTRLSVLTPPLDSQPAEMKQVLRPLLSE